MKALTLFNRGCSPLSLTEMNQEDREEVQDGNIDPMAYGNVVLARIPTWDSLVSVKPGEVTIAGYRLLKASDKPGHDIGRHGLTENLFYSLDTRFLEIPFYSPYMELVARLSPYIEAGCCPTIREILDEVVELRNYQFETEFLRRECQVQADLMQGILSMFLQMGDSELVEQLEHEIILGIQDATKTGYGELPKIQLEVTIQDQERAAIIWGKTLKVGYECPGLLSTRR